jgi:hypothetical protein
LSLQVIMEKVHELLAVQAELEVARARVRGLEADEARLSEREVPELLEAEGLAGLHLDDGRELTTTSTVRASIPSPSGISRERDPLRREAMLARREEAIKWLVDNGHDGLLKTELSLGFGRGELDRAEEIARALHDQGFDAELTETVNANTLSAFVREQLEAGAALPLEALGVALQRSVKIK